MFYMKFMESKKNTNWDIVLGIYLYLLSLRVTITSLTRYINLYHRCVYIYIYIHVYAKLQIPPVIYCKYKLVSRQQLSHKKFFIYVCMRCVYFFKSRVKEVSVFIVLLEHTLSNYLHVIFHKIFSISSSLLGTYCSFSVFGSVPTGKKFFIKFLVFCNLFYIFLNYIIRTVMFRKWLFFRPYFQSLSFIVFKVINTYIISSNYVSVLAAFPGFEKSLVESWHKNTFL